MLNKACGIYSCPVVGSTKYHQQQQQYRCGELLGKIHGALRQLLALQNVDFDQWARQLVWQRLHLPKSICPPDWFPTPSSGGGGGDPNATMMTFDPDSSILVPGEAADVTLNMTILSVSVNHRRFTGSIILSWNISWVVRTFACYAVWLSGDCGRLCTNHLRWMLSFGNVSFLWLAQRVMML